MPPTRRLGRLTAAAVCLALALAHPAPAAWAAGSTLYLPLVSNGYGSLQPPANKNDILAYVNYYRALAGVPPVTFDGTLNGNCLEHARYMAETGNMSHTQSGSAAGLICAGKGDIWLGWGAGWETYDSIDSWMGSVGHRLWLIYPTTPTFGYGFYADSASGRYGAALDVLSTFNGSTPYASWPVRYPAAGQTHVQRGVYDYNLQKYHGYPVTLLWANNSSSLIIGATSLSAGAISLSHTVGIPQYHKAIQLIADDSLPAQTLINVGISGTYNSAPFSYTWSFTTGP